MDNLTLLINDLIGVEIRDWDFEEFHEPDIRVWSARVLTDSICENFFFTP